MPACSFCKENYEFPRGTTFVLTSGEVLYFCSSKCQKNNKLGRVGKKTTWVRKEKKVKGSETEKVEIVEVKEESSKKEVVSEKK